MDLDEGCPLTDAEARLVRWLLEHGEAGAARFLPDVDRLRVVRRCPCGCASIDFTTDWSGPMEFVADFALRGDGVPLGGVFLFTRGGRLSGLEVWSNDAPITEIPEPHTLVPLPRVTPS